MTLPSEQAGATDSPVTDGPEATDSPDVLVAGGGFAGCIAALAAAREDPTAAVELLVTDDDRFDRHPGTVDVLGYPGASDRADGGDSGSDASEEGRSGTVGDGPVERPLAAVDSLPDSHPLRRLGSDRLRAALSLFDEALDYRGGDTERNALVVTHTGGVRPVARYPAAMAAGLASRDEPMRLVGFEQTPDFDAPLLAALLAERLPYGVGGATVSVPGTVTDYPSGPALARAFDDDEAPSGDVGTPELDVDEGVPPALAGGEEAGGPLRDPLVERVLPELELEGRVGFPAVLGMSETATIRRQFEDAFHADVFEVPIGPPSIPGRRLERRLHGALADAGVAVTRGTVVGVEARDGRIEGLSLADGERAVESVVLATGDLAGPGLVADSGGVHEPVFDCHVDHPADRLAWTEPDPLGEHAFARFGVAVDDDLRPLDASGRPEYDNLRAAGHILGGFDSDAEHSAGGVALATGHAAGRWSLP